LHLLNLRMFRIDVQSEWELPIAARKSCVCLRFTWKQNHDHILSSVSNKNRKSFHIDTKDFATQIYWSRDYTEVQEFGTGKKSLL
jgi:hypothetical protein